MGQKFIYLVRHGQVDLATGDPGGLGPHLSAKGREQAACIAERLSALQIDVVHHSDLNRAVETAGIIASRLPGVELKPSPLLQESIPYFPAAFMDWYSGSKVPSAEEARAAMGRWWGMWPLGTKWRLIERDQKRSARAYERYVTRARGADRSEVIVCHGNIIRYFALRALQAPPEAWVNADVNNCGLSEILVKPDGQVMLLALNDTGHLPAELKTFY
jgi:probable phosphoglycerate mutase